MTRWPNCWVWQKTVAGSDLIITGEGSLDAQTLEGKAPVGVAEFARRFGKPCIAFAGRVDPASWPLLLEHFDEITVLADGSVSTAEAIRRAPALLRARAGELASRWHPRYRVKTARFFSEPPHCLLLGVETLHN